VFLVGGNPDRAEIHHFDGTTWDRQILAGQELLIWVFGFSSEEAYAVGLGGTFLRWDGATWLPLATPTPQDLWGVWGTSGNDLYLVGGNIADGSPVILHYDGNAFEDLSPAMEENPQGARALFKVFGVDDEVFAVGQLGLILEKTGGTFTRVPAGADANDDFVSLYGTSASDLTVVGGRGSARIARYNGSTFDTTRPSAGGTNAVFVDGERTHVGGIPGFVGLYEPETDTVTIEMRTETAPHAMWGDGSGLVYAVGGDFAPPYRGLALVRSEQ